MEVGVLLQPGQGDPLRLAALERRAQNDKLWLLALDDPNLEPVVRVRAALVEDESLRRREAAQGSARAGLDVASRRPAMVGQRKVGH